NKVVVERAHDPKPLPNALANHTRREGFRPAMQVNDRTGGSHLREKGPHAAHRFHVPDPLDERAKAVRISHDLVLVQTDCSQVGKTQLWRNRRHCGEHCHFMPSLCERHCARQGDLRGASVYVSEVTNDHDVQPFHDSGTNAETWRQCDESQISTPDCPAETVTQGRSIPAELF